MDVIADAFGKVTRDKCKQVEPGLLVSQCRHGSSTSPASVETTRIPDDQLDEFFRQCDNPALDRGSGSVIVWVPLRPSARGEVARDINEELLNRVVHRFHLGKTIEFADSLYYHICTIFRSVNANTETDVFLIKSQHDWGTLSWAFDEKQRVSRGLYIAHEDSIPELQRLLESLVRYDQEPLYFGLVLLLFNLKFVGSDIDQIHKSNAAIESRTGHSNVAKVWAPKAEGDFASLSAATSGNAVELARAQQGYTILKNQLDIFDEYSRKQAGGKGSLGPQDEHRGGPREIAQCFTIARHLLRAADTRLTHLRDRSSIQLSAVGIYSIVYIGEGRR